MCKKKLFWSVKQMGGIGGVHQRKEKNTLCD